LFFNVIPVEIVVVANGDAFGIVNVQGGDANSFNTIRSSAEHVRIERPGPKEKSDARPTTFSSNGSAARDLSIPSASTVLSRSTRCRRANSRALSIRAGNAASSLSMNSFLAAEACQECEVHVASDARFAPSLDGDATNETGAPPLPVAECL